jgi:CheY-like chemotaxis protein
MAIVKSHDGIVTVYSEPGKGTTVKVYLPAVGASCEAGRAQPEEAGLAHGKGETILVVDDEVSILSIIGKSLHAFGYRVLTASDGGEGLAVYARHMDSISVVLTDITMPGMDGSAMIQALRRMNPEVVVIAASGLDVNGHRGSIPGVERFLTKPYTARTLLTVLRTILDKGETDQGERGEG